METNFSTDILSTEVELVPASTGKRFANYIIDLIFLYLLIFGVATVAAVFAPEDLAAFAESDNNILVERLFGLVIYAVYMSLVETAFKGKSLGKLITGTRAVNYDGSYISMKTAFARGFSRAVPFCVFSALGNPCTPWQDKWTNTVVIDEKETRLA